jgi:HprK-related kinase A
MPVVSTLTRSNLHSRLVNDGIYLQTGPFVTHVQSPIQSVADGIGLLYADYPLLGQADFADFHVCVQRPSTVRRWLRPQVTFLADGLSPYKPLPFDQAFPMLEWGLNWCVSMRAHRYLIIHAAVIEKGGYAVILPAPPGSGKSTLCAALVSRGWRLLSDELTLVRVGDGRLIPLPRPISLKNASIDIMQRFQPDIVMSPAVSDTVKGTVAHVKAPADSVVRSQEAAAPGWVIFPQYLAGAATTLEPMPKSRGFMQVAESCFNYSLLGRNGFDTLAQVIQASDCYRFTYSVLEEAIATFDALEASSFSL